METVTNQNQNPPAKHTVLYALAFVILAIQVMFFWLWANAFADQATRGSWADIGAAVESFIYGIPIGIAGIIVSVLLYKLKANKWFAGLLFLVSLIVGVPFVALPLADRASAPIENRLRQEQEVREQKFDDELFAKWLASPEGQVYKATAPLVSGRHTIKTYVSNYNGYFVLDNGIAVDLVGTIQTSDDLAKLQALVGKSVTVVPLKEEHLQKDDFLQSDYSVQPGCSYKTDGSWDACVDSIPVVMFDGDHMVNRDMYKVSGVQDELAEFNYSP